MGPNDQRSSFYILVSASLLLGLIISIYPFAPGYDGLRPEFICLLVIYWVTNTPQYFGVLFAWLSGMAQDIVEGVTWGSHALALSIVAYICYVAHQRIKNYSVWHQTLWIFVLVGVHQVVVNWVQGLAGYKAEPLDLILSTMVSALFWPVIFLLIGRIRHFYRMR